MEVKNITKKYDNKVIFDNFSYNFADGKITVVLGESGVGKTTLLSILAGLTDFEGEVSCNNIAYVFQNDRLVPNLTVSENLKLINNEIDLNEELGKVDLQEARDLFPSELSAGMSRRVAILRAMNYPSNVLLMDEPFRNLDYSLKYKLMDNLKIDHIKKKNTVILVTHDIQEAVYVADEIIVLDNGNIIKKFNKINSKTEKEVLDIFIKK